MYVLHVKRKIGEGQGKKKKCCKREAYSMIRSSQYWAFGSFFTFLICLSKRVDMINGHLLVSLLISGVYPCGNELKMSIYILQRQGHRDRQVYIAQCHQEIVQNKHINIQGKSFIICYPI